MASKSGKKYFIGKMDSANALVVAAFNLSAAVLLPRAKRIKAKMNEETNEDVGSSFVEDNLDDASSIHVDGDLEPEIIDEIEQEQAEMYLPTSSSYREEIVENQQNSSGSSRRTETPVFNDSAEKNDSEHSDSSDERELDDFTSLEYIGQEHRGPKKIKIHLKRSKSSGFGFRPVSAVAPEPIVTAVIEGSSAFRQGLKVGDRIRSVVVPGEIPTFHRTTSVTQIKEILKDCQDEVDLYIYRDMTEITTELNVKPLTPLGLGLQTTNVGIFVTSVQPGSLGDIYDYRFGDQILSINDQPVHDSNDIRQIRRSSMQETRKPARKPISKIFRSASSISNRSERRSDPRVDDRRTSWNSPDNYGNEQKEKIKIIIGRRSVDSYSEHPIAAIWSENENRASPLNILEPVFEASSTPSAPTESVIGIEMNPTETPQANQTPKSEEELLLSLLRTGHAEASSEDQQGSSNLNIPNEPSSFVADQNPSTSTDEPYLLQPFSPITSIRPSTSQKTKASSINDSDDQRKKEINSACVVCLEEPKEVVFQPCWHQITCSNCAVRLNECPLCREIIAIRRRPYRC